MTISSAFHKSIQQINIRQSWLHHDRVIHWLRKSFCASDKLVLLLFGWTDLEHESGFHIVLGRLAHTLNAFYLVLEISVSKRIKPISDPVEVILQSVFLDLKAEFNSDNPIFLWHCLSLGSVQKKFAWFSNVSM